MIQPTALSPLSALPTPGEVSLQPGAEVRETVDFGAFLDIGGTPADTALQTGGQAAPTLAPAQPQAAPLPEGGKDLPVGMPLAVAARRSVALPARERESGEPPLASPGRFEHKPLSPALVAGKPVRSVPSAMEPQGTEPHAPVPAVTDGLVELATGPLETPSPELPQDVSVAGPEPAAAPIVPPAATLSHALEFGSRPVAAPSLRNPHPVPLPSPMDPEIRAALATVPASPDMEANTTPPPASDERAAQPQILLPLRARPTWPPTLVPTIIAAPPSEYSLAKGTGAPIPATPQTSLQPTAETLPHEHPARPAATPHVFTAKPAGDEIRIALPASPIAENPVLVPAVTPAAPSAPLAFPTAETAPRPHDFAQLVDRLVTARDLLQPQSIVVAVRHEEFGPVHLRFRHDGDALAVAMTSADPDFARAVSAAPPPVLAANTADSAQALAQNGQRGETQSQASAGNGHSAQARNGAPERREDRSDPAANPGQHRHSEPRGSRRGGIFA